ncbi:MAG: hypothetical protein Q9162_001266 [Coniocarpon cinnabarinum]
MPWGNRKAKNAAEVTSALADAADEDKSLTALDPSKVSRRASPVVEEAPGDSERFGITELWPATPPDEPAKIQTTIDVIAVHGLGGDAFKTWTAGQRLWLRDFLPHSMKYARVLTFGYNSVRHQAVAFSGSVSRIDDFATQLLTSLKAHRRRTGTNSRRKSVFVCHSLGGLVFKQAIITAHNRSSRWAWFTESTTGVVFLGTPHRGADLAYWARVLGKIGNAAVHGRLRDDLLSDLQPKSRALGDLCSLFVERAVSMSICSFYERLKTPVINDLVIDKDSAVLHLPNETAIPLEANHRDLVKFLSESSANYVLVCDEIQDLVEQALDPADLPTSEKEEFLAWLQGKSTRFLWLHGSPGSGKSTTMKWLVKMLQAQSDDCLASLKSQPADHVIVFFFCDDKIAGRNSVHDVLCSIIELWELLASIVHKGRGYCFWIVIDALDELSDQSRTELLTGIENIFEGDIVGRLRLVTSNRNRLSQDSRLHLTLRPKLVDVLNEESRADVDDYVEAHVRKSLEDTSTQDTVSLDTRIELVEQLQRVSNGNFLFAKLALQTLPSSNKSITNKTMRAYLADLREKPPDLEAHYNALLLRIPARTRTLAKSAFQLLAAAQDDLSLEQFYFFLYYNDHAQSIQQTVEKAERHSPQNLAEMCGHLLVINRMGVVRFSHQSVKDRLVQKSDHAAQSVMPRGFGFTLQEVSFMTAERAHYKWLEKSLLVFRNIVFQRFAQSGEHVLEVLQTLYSRMSKSGFEFEKDTFVYLNIPMALKYVFKYCTRHGMAARAVPAAQELIVHFHLENDPSIPRLFMSAYQHRPYHLLPTGSWEWWPLDLPPLHCAIHGGDFPQAIKAMLAECDVNEQGCHSLTPLHWTIIRYRPETFSMLVSNPDIRVNLVSERKRTPLTYAIRWFRFDMASRLLEHPDIDTMTTDENG